MSAQRLILEPNREGRNGVLHPKLLGLATSTQTDELKAIVIGRLRLRIECLQTEAANEDIIGALFPRLSPALKKSQGRYQQGLMEVADVQGLSCLEELCDTCFHGLTRKCFALLSTDGTGSREREDTTIAECAQGCDGSKRKLGFAALCTLVCEAVKFGSGKEEVGEMLRSAALREKRAQAVWEMLESKETELQRTLAMSSCADDFEHIIGVDWRLDYNLRSSISGKVNEPMYYVSLKTRKSDGKPGEDRTFTCSLQELEDMVATLRDARKEVDRIVNLRS